MDKQGMTRENLMVQFLRLIQQGQAQSQLELAQQLGMPSSMAVRMAKDLAQRGYLEEVGADCLQGGGACSGCGLKALCGAGARGWRLTEKGERAITNIIHG